PHCFKFDDPHLSASSRAIFKQAEKVLSHKTSVFAVHSEHEKRLVQTLSKRATTLFIPNISSSSFEPATDPSNLQYIIMVGRISRQKDPEYFIQVIHALRALHVPLEPVWIGDGDTNLRTKLEAVGIKVTGWLSATEIEKFLHK